MKHSPFHLTMLRFFGRFRFGFFVFCPLLLLIALLSFRCPVDFVLRVEVIVVVVVDDAEAKGVRFMFFFLFLPRCQVD